MGAKAHGPGSLGCALAGRRWRWYGYDCHCPPCTVHGALVPSRSPLSRWAHAVCARGVGFNYDPASEPPPGSPDAAGPAGVLAGWLRGPAEPHTEGAACCEAREGKPPDQRHPSVGCCLGAVGWAGLAGGGWGSGGQEGRAGGWAGASGLCRREAGPAPHGRACPSSPTSTAPGPGRPHSGRPVRQPLQGGLCQPPRSPGVHTAGGVAAGEGSCHLHTKTGLGEGTEAGACPHVQLPGQRGAPQPTARATTRRGSRPFGRPSMHSASSQPHAVWPWASVLSSLACDVSRLALTTCQPGVSGRSGGGQEAQGRGSPCPHSPANGSCKVGSSPSPRRVLESYSHPRTAERGCPPPARPFLFSGP